MSEENIQKDIEELIPSMNLNLPAPKKEEEELPNLVSDDMLLGIYGEIIDNLRNDRTELDEILGNFIEMVINGGDATTSSKEALVNLMKIKSETSDKMAKIADLMTRVKLKEKNTYHPYLNAKQENTINISDSKREFLTQIHKIQKLKKKKSEEDG